MPQYWSIKIKNYIQEICKDNSSHVQCTTIQYNDRKRLNYQKLIINTKAAGEANSDEANDDIFHIRRNFKLYDDMTNKNISTALISTNKDDELTY